MDSGPPALYLPPVLMPDADRALRERIAEEASSDEKAPSIFMRAGQFFLVPLLIVLACTGIYLFFSYLVGERGSPEEWLQAIRSGGRHSRIQAMHQLVVELRRRHADDRQDPAMLQPLLATYQALPAEDRDQEDRHVRISLIGCLGLLRNPRAAEPLMEIVEKHPDAEVKSAAIESLGALKAVSAAPLLIKLLDHESSAVRKYATFNLAAIAAPKKRGEEPVVPEAMPHLRRKLDDPRPEVQWNAATSLAVFLGDNAGIPVLHRMLDRTHLESVIGADGRANDLAVHALQQACQAVAALKDATALDALSKVAESDPEPAVRTAARRAAEAIRKGTPDGR